MIAYMSHHEVLASIEKLGLPKVRFFDRDGSQAYSFANDRDTVVAFRGTEPNEWNDIRADVNAIADLAETIGRVHRGFKREADDVWPDIANALRDDTNTLWFCGHSLGGAMAAICAGRCKISPDHRDPEALFTFGSPRVGDKRYINYAKLTYYRWVNNNDIVTRVPPCWLGYRHTGQEMYLNAYGKLRKLTGYQRLKDRWRGFWGSIKYGRVDHFSDHSILEYVKHIASHCES